MRVYVLFLSLALAALAKGIADLPSVDWVVWFFAAFFFVLRTKQFMDDAYDLLQSRNNPRNAGRIFGAGFFFGAASWFFWSLSAWWVKDLSIASRYLLVAIIISTFWVAIATIASDSTNKKKYAGWLIFNLLYIAILIACSMLDPIVQRRLIGALFFILLLISIRDFVGSPGHRVLEKLNEA